MATGNIVDCDTELCLTPGGRSSRSTQKRPEMSVSGASEEKKISFCYGGQVSVYDVTEIQARAIICTAKREMEEMMKISGQSASVLGSSWTEPQLLNSRLSMKRSLQSFLQKRKTRSTCESTSPYLIQKQLNLNSDSSSSS